MESQQPPGAPPPADTPVPAGPLRVSYVPPANAILVPTTPVAFTVPDTRPPLPAAKPRRVNRVMDRAGARHVSTAEKVALAAIEAEVGGRPKLVACLAQVSLDAVGNRFLNALADPDNDTRSLAELCVYAAIPFQKVMGWVSGAIEARAQLVSKIHIADKLPDVTRGVMEDAVPGKRTCTACGGLGTYIYEPPAVGGQPAAPPEERKCLACRGTGEVVFEPELGVRKVALQLGGLLKKDGAKFVNQNMNLKASFPGASFDSLVEVTDKLLYGEGRARLRGSGPIQDGEVAE